MKNRIILGIFTLLISIIFIQSVFGLSFNSIASDKTYYKNGDTITITANLDANHKVFANFSDIENDNYLIRGVGGTGIAKWGVNESYNQNFSAKIAALGGDYSYVGTLSNALNIPLNNINNITFYYKLANDAVNITSDIYNTWPMYFRQGQQFKGGYFTPYIIIDLKNDSRIYQIISQQFVDQSITGNWIKWDSKAASTVYSETLWHDDSFAYDPNIGGSVPASWGPLSSWKSHFPNSNITKIRIAIGMFNGITEFQSAYIDYLRINDSLVIINEPNNLKKAINVGNVYTMTYPIAAAKKEGTANIPVTADDSVINNSLNIIIDNVAPVINNEQISPATIYNTNDVNLTANIVEANIKNVNLESNFEGILKNYTATNFGNKYQYIINSGNLSNQENVSYRWHAIDQIGFSAVDNLNSFKVQNRAPTFSAIPPIIFNEDSFSPINLSQYASDLDNDVLTFSNTAINTTAIHLNIIGNMMNITADPNWYGNAQFNIVATDPYFGITVYPVFVNVVSVNDIPIISGLPTQNILEDSGLNSSLDLTKYTTDVETASNDLTFYVTYKNDSQVNCAINADGDHLNFIPAANFSSLAYCNIVASDSLINSTEYKINFNVQNVNDAPTITSTAKTTAAQGIPYSYDVDAVDIDNDVLTYSLTTYPIGMGIDPSTGLIVWLPGNNNVGSNNVVVKVSDGTTYVTQSFTITVSNTNDLPTTPTLLSPEDAAIIYTNYATLSWSSSTDDDDNTVIYYVYFSNKTAPDFYTITPTTQLTIGNLQHSYVYYWYIVSSDSIGNQTKTPTRSFTVSLKNAPNITSYYPAQTSLSIAEGSSQLFNITASDVDAGDTLAYSWKLNNNEVSTSNSYTFSPNYTQSGLYTLIAAVTDSYNLTSTKTWTITATNTNRAPILAAIGSKAMNEDSSLSFNITATDDNGDVITYSSNDTKAVVNKLNNNLANVTFTPAANYFGTYNIKLIASDNNLTDEEVVSITVNNVNDAPIIASFLPLYNPKVKGGESQQFSITANDTDKDTLTITWYVDNVQEGTPGLTKAISRTITEEKKVFKIRADVTDNTVTLSKEWNLTVSNIPITETFSKETTNFSAINLAQATNVVLAKEEGKINFGSESLDLRNVIDLDNNIIIQDKFVGINTNILPQLNKPATIVMKASLNQPIIYYTDEFTTDKTKFTKKCSFCRLISYNKATKELVFTVEHFTTFMAGETPLELDIVDLDVKVGSKTDSNVVNGDTINEKAKPGNTIRVEATVKNQFTEDMKIEGIIVTGTLVGIDDGEDIEEESNDFDLNKGRSKRITLVFDIPKKIDEDIYDLDLNIEGEDENGTTHIIDWTIYLETKKDNHNIAIEQAEILPNKLSCFRSTKLNLNIVNYGKDNEDEVAYSVFSEELGIDKTEGYFELSEDLFSDNSILSRSIPIKVSNNFSAGTYPIIIKTYYNKDRLSNTKTIDLIIEDCEVKVKEEAEKIEVKPEIKKEIPAEKEKIEKEIKFTETPEYLALLAGGIAILMVLVIFAFAMMMRNRKENY